LAVLRKRLSPRGIQIKAESLAWSQIQGILARGDSRLAEVLANIDELSLANWRKAVTQYHPEIDSLLHRNREVNERLPWSMLDSGIPPGQLEREIDRALA
jgi:hypothetical protein